MLLKIESKCEVDVISSHKTSVVFNIGSRHGVDMIHLNKSSMEVVGPVPLKITITVIRVNMICLNKTRMKRVRTVSPRNLHAKIKSRYSQN